MSVRPHIGKLPPYDFAPHPQTVKLDQNELPSDLPAAVRAEVLRRVERIAFNRYPDVQALELRSELARLHDWPEAGIVITPGSNVLLRCLVIAAGIGQTVIAPTPTFGVYRAQAQMLGARLIEVPLGPRFALPVTEMREAMGEGRGLLFVANPAAPTGNLHERREIERLVAAAEDRWTVVIDEAYQQFAGSDFSDLARFPGVVSVRTLSKAFGLAAARIGYALMHPELAEQVAKTVMPFAVSELQQAAALAVLAHRELVEERVRAVVAERERLAGLLADFESLTLYPSVTNFILMRLASPEVVHRRLIERGVAVRRLPGGILDACLRVSVGTREENDRFLDALSHALAAEPHHG